MGKKDKDGISMEPFKKTAPTGKNHYHGTGTSNRMANKHDP
jgi:hypothetical protein